MSDQKSPLKTAIERQLEPDYKRPRRDRLEIHGIDERHESIEKSKADPVLYERVGGNSIAHGIYLRATKAIAAEFVYDPIREEQLARRTAGEDLGAEIEAELDGYDRRRAVALARGTFDQAREEASE